MWSHILNHLIMSLSGQHFFEWFSFSDVFLRTSFSELKPFWDLLNSLNRCWFPLPLYTLFSWGQWPCHLCMWLCPLLPQEIICGFHPWVKKIPWSRKWQLTPVFLLGNPMDRGAWWATVHGVIRSRTRLSDLHNKCNRTCYWRAWVWSEMALSLDLRPCYRPAQLSQRATPSNRVSVLHLLNGNNTSEWKWKSLSRVWLCDPMGSTVRGILQARILEWVAFPFRGSSQLRDQTQVSCIAGRFFTSWSTREAQEYWSG